MVLPPASADHRWALSKTAVPRDSAATAGRRSCAAVGASLSNSARVLLTCAAKPAAKPADAKAGKVTGVLNGVEWRESSLSAAEIDGTDGECDTALVVVTNPTAKMSSTRITRWVERSLNESLLVRTA